VFRQGRFFVLKTQINVLYLVYDLGMHIFSAMIAVIFMIIGLFAIQKNH